MFLLDLMAVILPCWTNMQFHEFNWLIACCSSPCQDPSVVKILLGVMASWCGFRGRDLVCRHLELVALSKALYGFMFGVALVCNYGKFFYKIGRTIPEYLYWSLQSCRSGFVNWLRATRAQIACICGTHSRGSRKRGLKEPWFYARRGSAVLLIYQWSIDP